MIFLFDDVWFSWSERTRDAYVRFWEHFPHNGSDVWDNGIIRKSATLAASAAAKRAKAAKSGRPPRAPEEGGLVPLDMPCTPHAPCIMPVLQDLQDRRIPRGPLSQVEPAAPDWRATGNHTATGPRARQRGSCQPRALAAASPSSRA